MGDTEKNVMSQIDDKGQEGLEELKKLIKEIRTKFWEVIDHYRFNKFSNIPAET